MLFDCRECGQCVLSATGMACPMNCPKQMRNGPCGGVREDGRCEVQPEMRCVWVEATEGTQAHRRRRIWPIRRPCCRPSTCASSGAPPGSRSIRGDAPTRRFQPPVDARTVAGCRPGSFEQACHSGRFVVTVEVAPPDSADPQALLARAAKFNGLVDAINITDGAGGNCHMSSVAASAILAAHGLAPVYQIACRDRNRIAIQGDMLGAAALGVKNILCITGDDVSQGDHPQAKPVFDLDAVSLLHIARGMCDRGEYASGRRLEPPRPISSSAPRRIPSCRPIADRIANLEKKVVAGARFIQTQFCFDVAVFEDFMREVRRRELHRRARIIVGVGTLGSARALRWMAAHVPGVHVPEALLARIEAAADQKAEGEAGLHRDVQALAAIEGVAGVHLMGHRNEDVLAEIIVESGAARSDRHATTQSATKPRRTE